MKIVAANIGGDQDGDQMGSVRARDVTADIIQ